MLKNKLNFKSMIIGLIVGISISASTIALAAPQQIEVLYDNIKILVNGKEIAMDEQPFIKNGRTFVPLRFISEAFGAEVTWNETTSTVNVNSVSGSVYNTTPTATPTPTPSVSDLPTSTPLALTTPSITNTNSGQTSVINKDTFKTVIQNEIEYISLDEIIKSVKNEYYSFRYEENSKSYTLNIYSEKIGTDDKITKTIKNITPIIINDKSYIEFNYFYNTLLPIIKGL